MINKVRALNLPIGQYVLNMGEVGKYEEVAEERIETMCSRELLQDVIKAIKEVHPYDEIAMDVYPLENI